MKAPYHVEVKVVEQKGTCDFGHKVGGVVRFDGEGIEVNNLLAFPFQNDPQGADYPWPENKDVVWHSCLDFKNPVIYEIRRFNI